jgi:hypothetical protein
MAYIRPCYAMKEVESSVVCGLGEYGATLRENYGSFLPLAFLGPARSSFVDCFRDTPPSSRIRLVHCAAKSSAFYDSGPLDRHDKMGLHQRFSYSQNLHTYALSHYLSASVGGALSPNSPIHNPFENSTMPPIKAPSR